MKLIPVVYHNVEYPKYIKSDIKEIAGHFDIATLKDDISDYKFSLHTEYSAKKREMNSELINKLYELRKSVDEKGIPVLWSSEGWAREFGEFITKLLNGKKPILIEIHPPPNNLYSKDKDKRYNINQFLDYYHIFYEKTIDENNLKKTIIGIENRNGFMISSTEDFLLLHEIILERNINLGLLVDFPQLLNAEKAKNDKTKLIKVLNKVEKFKDSIIGIHLWGQYGKSAHQGDLDDYFNNKDLKEIFLEELYKIFEDVDRPLFFVPEINLGSQGKNKNKCLSNIIQDLERAGFSFIQDLKELDFFFKPNN